MFYIIQFVIAWLVWLAFSQKQRWREILPVSLFSSFLACLTDDIMHHYKLWSYSPDLLAGMLNAFGIYIVVTYLFIQWLPREKRLWSMLVYWFIWTGICIGIEWINLFTHNMQHHKWWSLWFSYASDWILFWLFYQYHRVLKLNRLSE